MKTQELKKSKKYVIMYAMDLEKRARRQSLKIITSEIIMVITVIITVIVLAFLVSGYWLGSDFKVERQGMLQIYSTPTGANVAVDGDAPWFQRTNTSKVLSSGEHEIVLTKDGYDSWSRTVNITEGLLYRVHYPRLFLTEREKLTAYNPEIAGSEAPIFATVSPDHNLMLLTNKTTTWTLLNLNRDEVEPTQIDVSAIFNSVSKVESAKTGLFTGKILLANWSNDNEHILFKIGGDINEWVVLNVKNPKNSVNLTREFAADFEEIRIFDNSANTLLALRNGNLHKIDVVSRQISAVLAENIQSYDFYESDLIYSSKDEVFAGRLNDQKTAILTEVNNGARVLISKFYDEKYNFIITNHKVELFKHEDTTASFEGEISFIPENIKVGHDGSFIFMQSGTNVAVLDMEVMALKEWQLDSANFGWLDGSMLYAVKDGTLIVYDFDGQNRRELSANVSARLPVAITDNRWLYYFSDDALIREVIAK